MKQRTTQKPIFPGSVVILLLLSAFSHAQTQSSGHTPDLRQFIRDQDSSGTAYSLRLAIPDKVDRPDPRETLRKLLNLGTFDVLETYRESSLADSIGIHRYRRLYRGIPVEHGHYVALTVKGKVRSVHAEHASLADVVTLPGLTETQALTQALEQLGSELFAWEATSLLAQRRELSTSMRSRLDQIAVEEFPSGELVIVRDFSTESGAYDLAYRFEVESVIPRFKDRVYVNAHDGHIMLRDPLIKHGTGETRYAGTRSFPTSLYSTMGADTFQLKGIETVSGVMCETRNVNGFGGLPLSVAAVYALSTPILDGDQPDPCPTDGTTTVAETGDDNWLKNEHYRARFEMLTPPDVSCCTTYTPHPGTCNEIQNDDTALDAQWGASIVARYWKSRHGWNSFDNNGADIISFVHYGDAYNNAFWNGT
ncbi:MAG: hypothetical protein R3330_00725, partial [Saprospiraceae bacterium]|nr:hypothetical protein [Saprospiraceae bacterium]